MANDDMETRELFADINNTDIMQIFLADLHDNLPDRIERFRQLTDIYYEKNSGTNFLFGGDVVYHTWEEARSSFIHGNFIATILLCQGMLENLLAAFLNCAIPSEKLPKRIGLAQTLKCCQENNMLSNQEVTDINKLKDLRNPLSHHRHFDDDANLTSRSVKANDLSGDLLQSDASFAIGLVAKILGKAPFKLT
ncbi:MAG: hypothetical protein PSN37_05580 [Alphaproteobacteria bacterium]|nr:hypothetical protein [Alphaproteobacteria bacterium]